MSLSDASLTALRVFREVAERGTLTAAAAALGYTQSAVSRQIASLERAAGDTLLERRHDGVRLTPAGRIVLRHAASAVAQIDAAARELAGLADERATVRLGWYPSAGAGVLPRALTALRDRHPEIVVVSREGSTHGLIRAVRSGTLDLALIASAPPFRPPDAETPPLRVRVLTERTLLVAIPGGHPLARGSSVDLADLAGQSWIAGPAGGDQLLGAWPGLAERPVVAHTARDWLAKLNLVAAGFGFTTVPAGLASVVPPGVVVLPVRGGPHERRRTLLTWLDDPLPEPAARLAVALRVAAGGDV